MKYLIIALCATVSINAMHSDSDIEQGSSSSHKPSSTRWSDITNDAFAREILANFFGECDHQDMIESLVPYISKRIEQIRLNRSSRYHALRSSVSAQFRKKLEAHDSNVDDNIKEMLNESIEECYKEKELASKETIEKIQAGRTKFTALVSALTGISTAILTAIVTILLSNNSHEQPMYGSDSAATLMATPTIAPEVTLF